MTTAHRCAMGFALLAVLAVAVAPAAHAGGGMASPNKGEEGTLDVLVGGATPLILSLDVASKGWRRLDVAAAPVGPGEALAHAVNGCDYGLAGGGSTAFFSAAGVRGATAPLADTPAPVSEGGDLTSAPGLVGAPADHLYAVRGGGTRDFWRYSIRDNVWTVMPDAPSELGEGAALAEFSSRGALGKTSSYSVAALRGAGSTDFWCFNIDHDRWEAGPPTPAPVGAGGALAQMQGPGHIYALRGGGTHDFWRIDRDGKWVARARTPGPVDAGGALVAINYGTKSQRDVLYALAGGGSNAVWRYDIKTDTWTQVSAIPEALEQVAASPIR